MDIRRLFSFALSITILMTGTLCRADEDADSAGDADDAISYYQQIRPIFQAHCQGCHQPAKSSGQYVMTSFDRLLAGGESELAAISPGNPDDSYLMDLITPVDGTAEMPQGKEPLTDEEIQIIRRWIGQGARDDTPAQARQRYDMEHPPVYTLPPVVTSLDFSPDGQLLAVAGFHEVLVHHADGSGLAARLVGMSDRIESVRFSPTGSRLAVTGGLPGRMGEVQVWDVTDSELTLSAPVTFDTIYGGSWSPDGSLIALGCADNSLRAIDAKSGEQVLYQGAHNDLVRDTVFSVDGKHLVSVSRDMTTKLTDVATERFVDNVTSITPGALKGGITSVARHPGRDEIVIGGADGVPKVYRIFRQTNRVIGDDANLIRRLPIMRGRIFGVAVSADGTRIAAGSSMDGSGEVNIYSYEFDTSLPDNIKQILGKRVAQWNAEEKAAVEKYWTDGVQLLAHTEVPECGIYAVAFHPDGKRLAAAGGDGLIRLIDVQTGDVSETIAAAPLSAGTSTTDVQKDLATEYEQIETPEPESLAEDAELIGLEVQPEKVVLRGRFDDVQILVTGLLASGERVDVTRMVDVQLGSKVAKVSPTGFLHPLADGDDIMTVRIANQSAEIPIHVDGLEADYNADFIGDVNPVLSRLGCNQGTCHGAAKGKNGFKLSLRGYDAVFDVRALTDDLASRRVNVASPDDSLMLLKATGAVPHVGGQLIQPDEPYYQIIRSWIAGRATLDLTAPRVTRVELHPQNPVIQRLGARQQIRVLATYADGHVRDVTREAHVESGNTDVAVAESMGLMTAVRRGEAPILARYEGAYAATTLTVMGDRTGFAWEQPPVYNRIDQLTADKWNRMKIQPSEVCSDTEFIRRVSLDLTGLPPTADQVREFLADDTDSKTKREQLVDRLVGSEDYVEYWTNKWADLLQVNRKFLAPEGAAALRSWIRQQVADNTPYDQFVRQILVAEGSNRENPAAAYFKILREPADTMENTTHLFLAIRFNCNKCHDHPFERWTQDQYYQTAAYFAQVGLKRDPESGKRNIGGTAVEGAKPLYEIVYDKDEGEVIHDRTQQVAKPKFPYEAEFQTESNASRRTKLAAWLTSPDNRYFARSYVNRLWGYLFGVGIIEPIDDIRAGNPPTNPELLDYLTEEFLRSEFDVQHVLRLICKSRTYQLSIDTNRWNEDDTINYSHAIARRLPAEVLYDSVIRVTGSTSKFPGVPAGTRAAALPDSGVDLASGFLSTLGRPPRESACECDRSSGLQLGPVMAMVSGPAINEAIADSSSELTKLVANQPDNRKLIDEVVLRVLNRPATQREVQIILDTMNEMDAEHAQLQAALAEREALVAQRRKQQEQQREAAIVAAKGELEAFEKELAPKRAALQQKLDQRAAELEQELKQYEATLPDKLAAWASAQQAINWVPLEPSELQTTNGAKLAAEADRSVLVSGDNGQGEYTFVAQTDSASITAVRLEALADERLPSKGPGRSPNGNFVLSEFTLKIGPVGDPDAARPVKLTTALADFSQENYGIATAVDGKTPGANNGWAISPKTGVTHWATFQLAEPLGSKGPQQLTFTLNQRYQDNKHSLGRFRISVTSAEEPVGLSLPHSLTEALATAPEQRTDEQRDKLMQYFRQQDAELQQKIAAVAVAKEPIPDDPKLVGLRAKLAQASLPIPEDAVLQRLRNDVQTSEDQLKNRRLTAIQDLTWALINSPAFLFNH